MKFPMILTLLAAALGSTALYAAGAPLRIGMHSEDAAPRVPFAPEPQSAAVEHQGFAAGWFHLISNDDDDDDDDEDEDDEGCGDDEDDDCKQDLKSAPKAPGTPPKNGLFSTGKAPVVKSN